jgi:hypothetical protein
MYLRETSVLEPLGRFLCGVQSPPPVMTTVLPMKKGR